MLAVAGQPFDSETHFFEFKWDGFRAVALLDGDGLRLMSRKGVDLTGSYPTVSELANLPRGLALDGELVAFRDGKPDFELMLNRGTSGSGPAARTATIRYVAFDVLYENYASLMESTFAARRRVLERIVEENACPPLVLSEGIPREGRMLYKRACDEGLEGVVAKRLSSTYAAGKRNGAWIKIKRRFLVQVAIIGFIEKDGRDFQCLLIASNGLPGEEGGPLRFVGRVGSGFTDSMRAELNALLRKRLCAQPLVVCPERGTWVEPGLYCTVSFAEMTTAGLLRAPVFEGMIEA